MLMSWNGGGDNVGMYAVLNGHLGVNGLNLGFDFQSVPIGIKKDDINLILNRSFLRSSEVKGQLWVRIS